jgi:hypothetical protein
MKNTKHPTKAKPAPAAEPDEILAGRLLNLALELRDADVYADLPDALKKAQAELHRTIRKCLQQKREAALDEALEMSFDEDAQAYRMLRTQVEELAGTIVVHRDNGPAIEANAFVIPFFAHTTGGLHPEQCFQDEQAFEQLRESVSEHGLESRKANVVMVAHAYHPDELEKIGYCHLHAMVQEAMDAMTKKKATAADAITRSLSGWPPSPFAPDDNAMELRFLLGFVLKTLDDPFYHVPEKEAAADRHFEQRAERFRKWTQEITPVLKRCLVTNERDAQLDFLYQDLFHGGTEAARQELDMLRILSEVRQALDTCGALTDGVTAIVGPIETDDEDVLRVSLRAEGSAEEIANVEKSLSRMETMEDAIADLADGLASVGVRDIQLTRRFDENGMATSLRPYSAS